MYGQKEDTNLADEYDMEYRQRLSELRRILTNYLDEEQAPLY